MNETLRPFNKQPAAEHSSATRLEAIGTFTEEEILGLDAPVHTVTRGDELMQIPKAVTLLEDVRNSLPLLEALLKRFNLNAGRYDADSNRNGIFREVPEIDRVKLSLIRSALLHLLGVRAHDIATFFNGRAKKELVALLSPAYSEAVEDLDRRRETYALRHLDSFPRVRQALATIQEHGFGWDSIFREGKIPALRSGGWRKDGLRGEAQLSLEDVLVLLGEVLSSKTSLLDIARKHTKNRSTVEKIMSRKGPFTEAVYDAVERIDRAPSTS